MITLPATFRTQSTLRRLTTNRRRRRQKRRSNESNTEPIIGRPGPQAKASIPSSASTNSQAHCAAPHEPSETDDRCRGIVRQNRVPRERNTQWTIETSPTNRKNHHRFLHVLRRMFRSRSDVGPTCIFRPPEVGHRERCVKKTKFLNEARQPPHRYCSNGLALNKHQQAPASVSNLDFAFLFFEKTLAHMSLKPVSSHLLVLSRCVGAATDMPTPPKGGHPKPGFCTTAVPFGPYLSYERFELLQIGSVSSETPA